MAEVLVIAALVIGFVLPLAHVGLSRRGGPWSPPAGTRCPLGPRAGWLVLVLAFGPLGWLAYMMRRRRASVARRAGGRGP